VLEPVDRPRERTRHGRLNKARLGLPGPPTSSRSGACGEDAAVHVLPKKTVAKQAAAKEAAGKTASGHRPHSA
jgi:hypothetical protein